MSKALTSGNGSFDTGDRAGIVIDPDQEGHQIFLVLLLCTGTFGASSSGMRKEAAAPECGASGQFLWIDSFKPLFGLLQIAV